MFGIKKLLNGFERERTWLKDELRIIYGKIGVLHQKYNEMKDKYKILDASQLCLQKQLNDLEDRLIKIETAKKPGRPKGSKNVKK